MEKPLNVHENKLSIKKQKEAIHYHEIFLLIRDLKYHIIGDFFLSNVALIKFKKKTYYLWEVLCLVCCDSDYMLCFFIVFKNVKSSGQEVLSNIFEYKSQILHCYIHNMVL